MVEFDYKQIAKLVAQTKKGDSNAFAKLYELTYQKVYFFSMYLTRDKSLAEDVVQETFIHALKSIKTLKDDKLFIAWLTKINYSTALKILEKEKNVSMDDDTLYNIPDDYPNMNPMHAIIQDDEKRDLLNLISTLPYGLKAVIIMKYYEDMKESDIALALDCPVGTVKSRLNKARSLLKEKLTARGEAVYER